jgi:hypothetical protein
MPKKCPSCGKQATGRFCSHCGSSLLPSDQCGECGNSVPEGGSFCNLCGTPVTAAGKRKGRPAAAAPPAPAAGSGTGTGNPQIGWYVAGAALLVAVLALVVPRMTASDPAPGAIAAPAGPVGTAPGAGPGAIDLSTMTPREAADRLFNRVMENVSAGDSVQARTFLPMALAAYDRVEQLDLDGHYHVAVLHLVGNDPDAARREADTILAEAPEHLFGLFTAAQAEDMRGNTAEATTLYRRFLESYDDEIVLGRLEYEEHAQILPVMRQDAMNRTGA